MESFFFFTDAYRLQNKSERKDLFVVSHFFKRQKSCSRETLKTVAFFLIVLIMKNPLTASTLSEYFFYIQQSQELSEAFHAEIAGNGQSFELIKIEKGTFVVNNVPEGEYSLKLFEGSQINDNVNVAIKTTKDVIPSLITEKGRYAIQHTHLRIISFMLTIREKGGFSMEKSVVKLIHLKEEIDFQLSGANSYRIESFPQGLYEVRILENDLLRFVDTLNLYETSPGRKQLTITVGVEGNKYFYQKGLIQPFNLQSTKLGLTFSAENQKSVWELCSKLTIPIPSYDKFKPVIVEKSISGTIIDFKNFAEESKQDIIKQLNESGLIYDAGSVIVFGDAKNIDYVLTNEIVVGWNPASAAILNEFAHQNNLQLSVIGPHMYKLKVPVESGHNTLVIADSIRRMYEYVEYAEPSTLIFR